jgi:uncharacterized membrane protein YhhN
VTGSLLAPAALTLAALAALLAAEWRGPRGLAWVAKPLASAGFVALALRAGAAHSAYGRVVLAALLFCWLGDVLLLPRGARRAFLAGLASFLAGHVAFAAAFALRGVDAVACAAAAAAVGLTAALALRWLAPHVPPRMVWPVRAYVAAISAMAVLAAGAARASGDPVIAAGAAAFFVSDLAVARERFVRATPWNRAWGLPLYYAGTLLLAASVAGARPLRWRAPDRFGGARPSAQESAIISAKLAA